MPQRYVITGGAGFIGSHLARRALQEGALAVVIDNFSTGREENLRDIAGRVEIHRIDILDLEALPRVLRADDIVFHEAAIPSVPRSVAEPVTSIQANIFGTFHLLLAARDCRVRRVVFASSSSVYGNLPGLPKNEAQELNPLSPYAASKMADEGLLQAFTNSYGLETVALRYFNVFGPRQDPASQYAAVIPRFITRMLRGERPVIFGDGKQSRDFTYIDNVVDGNWLAAHAPAAKVAGRVMNLACGSNHTLNDLVAALNRILGTTLAPVYDPPRVGDILHSYPDVSRARDLLGFQPRVDFEEGLRRTVEFFRASQESHG